MSKELTKEEEEFYNKLWLENKELIQDNMNKLSMERFELELELVDKDKEIERLNNIIKELEKFICDLEIQCNIDNSMWGVAVIIHNKLKELKGSDK